MIVVSQKLNFAQINVLQKKKKMTELIGCEMLIQKITRII